MPPAKFGALLGVAPGNVPAYSSDYDSSDVEDRSWYRAYHEGVYTGYKYQCVEYARRWLVHVWGVSFGDVRMAFNIFDLPHFVWTTHGEAKVRHLNATMDAKHRTDVAVFEREHQLFLLQEQGTQKKCATGAIDTTHPSSTSHQTSAQRAHAHPHHHGGGGDAAAHHLQHPSHPHLHSQLHSPVTGPATESSRRASTTLGASSSVLAASSVHSVAPVPASDTDTVSETESTGTVTPWESLCSSTSELDTDAMITGEAVAKKEGKCQSSKRVRSEKQKDQATSAARAPTAVAVPPPAVSAPTLPVKPVPHPTVDGGDVVPILKVRNADPMGHCPEVGSVLLWHEGGFFKHTGHVAIITEVTDTYVRIAEQNVTDRSWKGKAFARELPMTWLGGEAVVPRSQSRDMSIRQMKSGKKHEFFHGAEHPQSGAGKKIPASSGSADENDVEVIKVGWEIKDAQYRNTKVLGWVTPQIAPEFQLIVEAAKPVVPSPQKA